MTDFNGSFSWLVEYHVPAGAMAGRVRHVDKLPATGVSVVMLGGALTTSENVAMGYMSKIAPVLQTEFTGVGLYAGYYQFNDVDPMLIKAHTFRMGGCRFPLSVQKEQQLKNILENDPEIGYVQDLYDATIAPCLNGSQISTARNLRRVVFYTDCHGSVTLYHMVNKAKADLKAKGWSDDMVAKTLKNIVAIQHEPTSPLANVGHTSYSFVAAADGAMDFHDTKSAEFIGKHDMQPTYMGEDYSNLLVVGKIKNDNLSEHGFKDVFGPENNPDLTENGRLLYKAQRNVLRNVVRAAQKHEKIPTWCRAVSTNVDVKSIAFAKGVKNER